MLPSVPQTARRDVAHVTRIEGGLRIELVTPDAAVMAERSLDVEGSCAELAAVAAVVIATWESDVHPEFTRPRAEPIPVAGAPVPIAPPTATVSRSPASYDLAMGPSLSWASTLAAGATLSGTWIARGAGLGIHVFATGETTRTVDLSPGQANWRRWMGGLEADWRLLRGRAALDMHAGLGLSWLSAEGANFLQNKPSQTSFSPGAVLGVRSSWGLTRHFAVSLDLVGLYWTRSQSVSALPLGEQRELPHFQGLASVGLALRQSAPGP